MPVPAPPIYAAYELSLSKKMLPSAKCATGGSLFAGHLVAYVIMPLFALANAGVSLDGVNLPNEAL